MALLQFITVKLKNLRESYESQSVFNKWCIALFGTSLITTISRYTYDKLYKWWYQLPPGPFHIIPSIGNTINMLRYSNTWHIEWAMKYGPILSFYEINKMKIIINDSKMAKEIFSKSNTLDRQFPEQLFRKINKLEIDEHSILTLDGDKWSKLRKLFHTQIVRVMNTKYVNDIIYNQIQDELEPELNRIISDSSSSNIWYCREDLSQITFNTIFQANFGKRASFDNDKLCKQLAKDLVEIISWKHAKWQLLEVLLPNISKYIIPDKYFMDTWNIRDRVNNALKNMIMRRNKDRNKLLPKSMDKDEKTFMDHIQEMAVDDNFEYTQSQQISDIYIMFLAGTDTTALSLEWGLILLSRQKDVQNRVRNELMTVLKKENQNQNEIVYDIQLLLQLPLFRACIHEILRISCVSRMGLDHTVTEKDIWINTDNGIRYRIPNGSSIIYNVECMHYNNLGVENWKNDKYGLNMEQICLENWIDDETKKFYQNPSFMSFGYGKRDCIGKQLAMKEMRIILGYLLLNYRFSVEKKFEEMISIPCSGGVRGSVCKPAIEIPIKVQRV